MLSLGHPKEPSGPDVVTSFGTQNLVLIRRGEQPPYLEYHLYPVITFFTMQSNTL